MNSFGLALAPEGKREDLGETKGKRENAAADLDLHFHLTTRPRARTHERNEADFSVGGSGGLTPPTSDILFISDKGIIKMAI